MRQYQVNELTREERQAIAGFLNRNTKAGVLDGLFWLPVPPDLGNSVQQEHANCGPFYFAIELGEDFVSFELLVRSSISLHCACIGYAAPQQRDFLIDFIERMLAEEKIRA
ncbi:MAG: hypothetical protein A2511_04825 [Deltaproteobacteria bacterium RIFOXYD12_FULL_50_9]|nr:MAG: hypothetical protein A2511_04825 [Deltaproteobacteria bacterium RIFOXYD12_FULL_50_9]